MTDAPGVRSGGRQLSPIELSPIELSASTRSRHTDDVLEGGHWAVDALVVGTVCMLAVHASIHRGWRVDDGAAVIPAIALAGIWMATTRRRPDRSSPPVRVVSVRLSLTVAAAAIALSAVAVRTELPATVADVLPDTGQGVGLIGPMVTLAVLASYLALWGFRSLALLRTVTLLSLLTWEPIAGAVHDVVRSSLDQPSELVYQRLGRLGVFGVDDEPWTLFTASLHRGSLVVITIVVLGIAA
ncbi:MAG: hypothetical protein AAFP84_16550, partial [Actinomycetota bacterium]